MKADAATNTKHNRCPTEPKNDMSKHIKHTRCDYVHRSFTLFREENGVWA